MAQDQMRYVAFDTETHLIEDGNQAPTLVCVSTSEGLGREKLFNADDGLAEIWRLLADPYVKLIGFNTAFDIAVLMRHANEKGCGLKFNQLVISAYENNRITCGMLREKLRDLYRGSLLPGRKIELKHDKVGTYSLAGCVKRLLDQDISSTKDADAWRMHYWQLNGMPVEQWPVEAAEYAMKDATYHYCVHLAQNSASHEDAYVTEYKQARAHLHLHLQSVRGVITDGAEVQRFSDFCDSVLVPLQTRLVADGLMRRKEKRDGTVKYIMNTKTVETRILSAMAKIGEKPDLTPTGKPKRGKRSLLACESVDPLLGELGKAQQARHARNTEVPLLSRGVVTPIHTRYNSILETGRTSSSPNVQNRARLSLPCACGYQDKIGLDTCPKCGRWMGNSRRCFKPRDGYLYCASDYAQLELCTLADAQHRLIGKSTIGDAINQGIDLHTLLASDMLGISYAEAMTRKKAGDIEIKSARQRAKGANFGLPGGMGARGLQAYLVNMFNVFLTIRECKKLIYLWRNRWHDMAEYFRVIKQHFAGNQYMHMTLPSTGLRRGSCRYTAACNFLFQASAAAGAKAAGFEILKRCIADPSSALFGSYIVLFLHDEYLLEVPIDRAHEAAIELAEVMRATMQDMTPKVKIKMPEAVLMRRWYKSAEPVFDSSGRLIPWEPSMAA